MIPKKILFCADFSENSEHARELAVDYAKAFEAELLIIHVIDSGGLPNTLWMIPSMVGELLQFFRHAQEVANARLASLASEYRQVIKHVKTYCTVGHAPNEIVALANEESVDLIVMGTHGRTGVKHLVIGSIARSVLRMAHRPVLIVEAHANAGESSDEPYEFPVQ